MRNHASYAAGVSGGVAGSLGTIAVTGSVATIASASALVSPYLRASRCRFASRSPNELHASSALSVRRAIASLRAFPFANRFT